MKICPKCNKTYTDESLNFCLDDGTVLNQTGAVSDGDLPETVMISQPRPTAVNQQFGNQPVDQSWGTAAPVQPVSPQKSSKTWLWVVGILVSVVVVCGGGLLGLIAIGSMGEEPQWNANFVKNNSNIAANNTNSVKPPVDTRTNITKVDLSEWVRDSSEFGQTVYRGNELFMNAKQDKFYYVLVAPKTYKTDKATTKVTLRNADNGDNSLGYGLIIHSNPVPLKQDYAFLIDTNTQKYRIVSHTPGKEETITDWTSSAEIKSGSESNVLEVRDEGDKLNFYINGEFITAIDNTNGYPGGVAGIYVGGKSPIAFSNLEIRK